MGRRRTFRFDFQDTFGDCVNVEKVKETMVVCALWLWLKSIRRLRVPGVPACVVFASIPLVYLFVRCNCTLSFCGFLSFQRRGATTGCELRRVVWMGAPEPWSFYLHTEMMDIMHGCMVHGERDQIELELGLARRCWILMIAMSP